MVREYKKIAKIYIKDVIRKIRDVISIKGYSYPTFGDYIDHLNNSARGP